VYVRTLKKMSRRIPTVLSVERLSFVQSSFESKQSSIGRSRTPSKRLKNHDLARLVDRARGLDCLWVHKVTNKLRGSKYEFGLFAHPVKTRVIGQDLLPTVTRHNLAITLTNSQLATLAQQHYLQQHHLYYNHDALYNDALYFGRDAFHRSASKQLGIGGLVGSSGQLVGKDSPTHFVSNSSLVRQHRANEQHG
jgi:hypothetical protein